MMPIPRVIEEVAEYLSSNSVEVAVCAFALIVIFWLSCVFLRGIRSSYNVEVSELLIYPVKSCRGVKVSKAKITARGLENDRIFAVVKGDTMDHISLRCTPRMALIVPQFSSDGSSLVLSAPELVADSITIPLAEPPSEILEMKVWDSIIEAREVSTQASVWVSTALGVPGLRLMRVSDRFIRRLGPEFSAAGQTALADEAPVMMVSQRSLDAVNSRLKSPINMQNFRPNIVIRGCSAFVEDSFKTVTIGSGGCIGCDRDSSGLAVFKVAKLTSRCSLPNIDAFLGVRDNNLSVTKALRSFRTGRLLGVATEGELADTVFFGTQLDNEGCAGGEVCVGDSVAYTCE
jgi:uncharacterized protein